mgnify:CR=1 FL=1
MLLHKELKSIEDIIGDNHLSSSTETPLRKDAFKISDRDKIKIIEENVANILFTLGMDMTDDSLKGTPKRVAKMYINEIFSGLNPKNKPHASTFENKYKYGEVLVEKNITLFSTCEHHLLPIVGKAHIGYISNGNVIGLSKINRIVQYFAQRPQVQERLTQQILVALQTLLETDDVAVTIEATHYCVKSRGVMDTNSSTQTTALGGQFKEDHRTRAEFLR